MLKHVAIAVSLSVSLGVVAADQSLDLSGYIAKAKTLYNDTHAEPTPELAAKLAEQGLDLVEDSKTILAQVIKAKPQCADYLNKTLAAADAMLTMDLDTIERDYHKDGALPKAPGECYHAKDLLVHPATAVVLARGETFNKDTLETIEHEIEEVLSHAQVTEALIK